MKTYMSHPIEPWYVHVPSYFLWPGHGLQRTPPIRKPPSPVRSCHAGRNLLICMHIRKIMTSKITNQYDDKWQDILKDRVLKFHGEFRPYHQEHSKKQYLFHRCSTDIPLETATYCTYIVGDNFSSMDRLSKTSPYAHAQKAVPSEQMSIYLYANTQPLEHLRIASDASSGLQRKQATWQQRWAQGQK